MAKKVYLNSEEWKNKIEWFKNNGFKINQPKHGNTTFTILGQGEHKTFINLDNCKVFTLPNGEQGIFTPGEAARKTLEYFYPHGYEAWGGYRKLRKVPPMWLSTTDYNGNAHYFDFVSAYWIIYRRIWLDSLYPHSLRLKSKMPLNDCGDWLYGWKEARNGLMGCTYSNQQLRYWYDENHKQRIKPIYTNNKFFNPSIWCIVNEVLHDIAHIAIRLNAFFVATDGYLLPEESGFKFASILDRCGLYGYYRHYVGKVQLLGWGAYSINGKNIHSGKDVKKETERFQIYKARETANPKVLSKTPLIRIPLYKRGKIYKVGQYHRLKEYNFLNWWSKLKEPTMSNQIVLDRKEKINND